MIVKKEKLWELEFWFFRLRCIERETVEPLNASIQPNPDNVFYQMTQELKDQSADIPTKHDLRKRAS